MNWFLVVVYGSEPTLPCVTWRGQISLNGGGYGRYVWHQPNAVVKPLEFLWHAWEIAPTRRSSTLSQAHTQACSIQACTREADGRFSQEAIAILRRWQMAPAPVITLASIRNWLKNQSSNAQRGQAVSWKKDCDPATPSDVSLFWAACDMLKWLIFSRLFRWLMPYLYPAPETLCYYDERAAPSVHGLVALTIDDCFCRQEPETHSLVQPVRALLARFHAKATFFVTLCHANGDARERDIVSLLSDEHEIANHGAEVSTAYT